VSAPLLTRAEMLGRRPNRQADRDYSDLLAAESALFALRAAAGVEAVYAARDRRAWPEWVEMTFCWWGERRDRQATRRELREMAQ